MKILVVNLLRLGDVIAMTPAIKALRMQHPKAEIHLMINGSFETAAKQISGIDQVIRFERDRMQSACVEAERPMFEAYDFLQQFIDEMSERGYDVIYNFTHNRLSGWLCGLIEAKSKIGLVLDGSGAVSFGSAWFRHLNQQVDFDDVQAFNHTDVFLGAAGGIERAREIGFFDGLLRETPEGQNEARSLLPAMAETDFSRIVAFQISTSDAKKEWGDARFLRLAGHILKQDPNVRLYILGAPDERSRIEAFCQSLADYSSRVQPAVLSLTGLVSFLESTDLLVTGDTSIKHFAAAGTVRTVELIVGSADAYRTGSWKAGDIVISGRELCAPCGHSENCHRTTHACAIGIAPESVADVVMSILADEDVSIARHRWAKRRDIQIFEVDRSEGVVSLTPITDQNLRDETLAVMLERSARRLAIEARDRRFDPMRYGSEILNVKRGLNRRFSETTAMEMRHALADGEARLRHAEGIVHSLGIQLARLKESIQDPKRMHEMISSIFVMRSRLQKNPWTRFIAEPLNHVIEDDRSAPFVRYRKLSDSVQDLELRLKLGLKLVRGLENEFENDAENENEVENPKMGGNASGGNI